ncbi:hypothetical protein M7I_3829 [Glarea lozoyensis 74030]|uniref:Uncharacterized protein n=1 Tax=Glarea lozoyensis (strain ATCC 74030 / MF5533) TaxID=1104152 RepID=H0EMJ2_GLAL7|nr:hypothetical protein M7I_3829 [Glarea lozoyensis 74030]
MKPYDGGKSEDGSDKGTRTQHHGWEKQYCRGEGVASSEISSRYVETI